MNAIRKTERGDCRGCIDEHFMDLPQKCWCFNRSVIVVKLKVRKGESPEQGERVQVPNCYKAKDGVMHLYPPTRSVEGGDAA